ncbi:hypothetical protein Dip518_000053 [Parelusimicrobium proximum]|uniref:hypothetical protein n=1 Tax=Parelusimicrobium proximum TaxID=3228953 RepID=UPI003D162934
MKKLFLFTIILHLSMLCMANTDNIMEFHVTSFEICDLKKVMKKSEDDNLFAICLKAPPKYEGKISIAQDYSLKCEFCSEILEKRLNIEIEKALTRGLKEYPRFTQAKKLEDFEFALLKKGDELFNLALKDALLNFTLARKALRELNPEIGETYLKNKRRKEKKRDDLLIHLQFFPQDIIIEKNIRTLYKQKILKESSLSNDKKQMWAYIVSLQY